MIFEIEWGSSRRRLADLGLFGIRRRRLNQGRDILSFSENVLGFSESPPLFDVPTPVKLHRDGHLFFQGTIAKVRSDARCDGLVRTYEVWGPFWELESIIYQQLWKMRTDPADPNGSLRDIYKSHIILGQSMDGKSLTLAEQLVDILDYAREAGANLMPGDLNFPQILPPEECRDLSCAESIQRLLRWIPDATLFFDYETDPATLQIRRYGDLKSISPGSKGNVRSFSIAPRRDLQLVGVAIKYERNHSVDGRSYQTMDIDRFPENLVEQSPRVAIFTIQLEGSRSVYLRQKVEVEPIHPESAVWWKNHLPALQNLPDGAISVLSHSRLSRLPSELTGGCIADWMPVRAEMDRISAQLSYRTSEETVLEQTATVVLCATDAEAKTYGQMTDFRPEEPAPKGLAKVFQESFSAPFCEGEMIFESAEIEDVSLGQSISLAGLSTDLADLRAAIQEIDEDLDSGRVRIRLGLPSHLGLRNLVELSRMNRRRESPHSSLGRAQGEGANAVVEQPMHVPQKSVHVAQTSYEKIVVMAADRSRRIVLDAADIGRDDLVLQIREEQVCENGVLRRRLALSSQTFPENSFPDDRHG